MKLKYKFALPIFFFGSVLLIAFFVVFFHINHQIIWENARTSLHISAEDSVDSLETALIEKSKTVLTLSNARVVHKALLLSNSQVAVKLTA